jgi:hypothetical protein
MIPKPCRAYPVFAVSRLLEMNCGVSVGIIPRALETSPRSVSETQNSSETRVYQHGKVQTSNLEKLFDNL